MENNHQQITVKDETFVLVPLKEYALLSRFAEAAEDEAEEAWATKAYDEHMAAKARGEDLAMPKEQWARIREGVSPVLVVREYRGLTQKALAEESGITQSEISAIEAGKRRGTVDTFMAIGRVLKAPVEVLAGGAMPAPSAVAVRYADLSAHLGNKSLDSPPSSARDLEAAISAILTNIAAKWSDAPNLTAHALLESWRKAAYQAEPTVDAIIAQARGARARASTDG